MKRHSIHFHSDADVNSAIAEDLFVGNPVNLNVREMQNAAALFIADLLAERRLSNLD